MTQDTPESVEALAHMGEQFSGLLSQDPEGAEVMVERMIAGLRSYAALLASSPAVGAALSHDDLCCLSRLFNQSANLWTSQDRRINEWLKEQIAVAYHLASLPAAPDGETA